MQRSASSRQVPVNVAHWTIQVEPLGLLICAKSHARFLQICRHLTRATGVQSSVPQNDKQHVCMCMKTVWVAPLSSMYHQILQRIMVSGLLLFFLVWFPSGGKFSPSREAFQTPAHKPRIYALGFCQIFRSKCFALLSFDV